jgi:hypothetical protein
MYENLLRQNKSLDDFKRFQLNQPVHNGENPLKIALLRRLANLIIKSCTATYPNPSTIQEGDFVIAPHITF